MKNVLIVGAGGIAHTHVEAIKRIPEVRIAGVCDIVRERAREFAKTHDLDTAVFSEAGEAVRTSAPDYVLLLTPADARLDTVRACADAGVPVFMEKPPCSGTAEGEEMLRVIESAGLIHGVGFMSRYNEILNRVLSKIRSERLSMIAVTFLAPFADPTIVAKYPYPFLVERSGGIVGDQGIHYVDVCRYIAQSEVKALRAVGVNQSLPRSDRVTTCDAACWWLEMANGVLASHSHTWSANEWECRINLVTDKSDVVVDMFRNTAAGKLSGRDFSFSGSAEDPQGFERENRAFLEAVNSREMTPVRSTFADALKSFRVVQDINRQIYNS